ncbi:unnamed protein product [Taenia asiatica]|uniref:Uncharacterized protein n=1 Tax=Taenia asiatica TaxID=60517 RepID=A0A0R3W3N6_TAEAS|nr:unnamed protein product [Taenia asiatica]
MDPAIPHETAPQGLMVEENTQCASVEGITSQVLTTASVRLPEEKQNDVDEDDDDIISKALRYAGIEPTTPSTHTCSAAVAPARSASTCTIDSHRAQSTFHKPSAVSSEMGNLNVHTAANQSIRIVMVSSFSPPQQPQPPSLPRPHATGYRKVANWERILPCYRKYMRFNDVNPNTAISVAIAAASAADGVGGTSNAEGKNCRCLPRQKRHRRKFSRSDQSVWNRAI